MLQKMTHGQDFHLQKMYNKESLTLAFPTASGLPFMYQLMRPTVISAQGKVQAEIQPKISRDFKSAKASAQVKLMYSTKTEASFGFVAPFNGKTYTAGLQKDAQFALPIRAELEIQTAPEGSEIKQTNMRLKLQPLKPEEDAQIAILRSKPYTAQQKVADLKPIQMKTIKIQRPHNTKFVVGRESTGMAFRIEASAEKQIFDYAEVLRHLQQLDALSAIASATEEQKINKYEYTITYDHDHSRTKAVQFTAKYGELNKKPKTNSYEFMSAATYMSGSSTTDEKIFNENLAIPTSAAPASSERLQQFLHRVAETMKSKYRSYENGTKPFPMHTDNNTPFFTFQSAVLPPLTFLPSLRVNAKPSTSPPFLELPAPCRIVTLPSSTCARLA